MQPHEPAPEPLRESPDGNGPEPTLEELEAQFARYIEEAAQEAQAGSPQAAMLAALQALMTAGEGLEIDPSKSAQLLRRKAALVEACDWSAALKLQQEIVQHALVDGPKEVPDAPPHYAPAVAAHSWEELARLQLLCGQPAAALESATTAEAHARQADISPTIAQTLLVRTLALLKLGRAAEARNCAEAAVHIFSEQGLPFAHSLEGRSRVLLARCLVELGETPAAGEELAKARPLLERFACQRAIQLAAWHEVQAALQLREGRSDVARATLIEAIKLREQGEPELLANHAAAADRRAETLEHLAGLLEQAGETADALTRRREAAACRARFRLPAVVD